MGIDNVQAAYVKWRRLDDRPMRLLLKMAAVSMDQSTEDQPARRCFVHWSALALALGYDVPPDSATDTASVRARHTARVGTWRVTRRLEDAGAVKEVRRHGRGRSTEYELLLD